jgi:hypothetical protein
MSWQRLGLVYVPDGSAWWARRNASFPTAVVRPHGRIGVYYTALDDRQDGRTGYLEVSAEDPLRVVGAASGPVLDIGRPGEFDDCGVNAFSAVTLPDCTYLYYQGWQRTAKAPYAIFTGLAMADADGGSFRKHSRVPILERTDEEPYIRGAPFVRREDGRWRMWYASCTGWTIGGSGARYRIVIRSADSTDCIHWTTKPGTCLEPQGAEYGVGRPWVIRDAAVWRMWYSIRSDDRPYRIGYAESVDGDAWTRIDDRGGLERTGSGWESAMVCYPSVVDVAGRRYLFYNGNTHGATGFGVAEWVGPAEDGGSHG